MEKEGLWLLFFPQNREEFADFKKQKGKSLGNVSIALKKADENRGAHNI